MKISLKLFFCLFIMAGWGHPVLAADNSSLKFHAETINEADSSLCDTITYAFIQSLSDPIGEAVGKIYKDFPEVVSWMAYDTKILKIKQLYGVGGAYEVTLKIFPYYGPHNYIGEDKVKIRVNSSNNLLIGYEHLKTYQ
jgi:Protein of unknown function (DUF3888)